jgi:simple sugar transport system ATP-binding protein
MHHVFACCDRIVAMALGQIVLDKPAHETSIEEVSELL